MANTKSGATKHIKVTQIHSAIGRHFDQRQTLIGLGLNRRHRSRTLEDTPSVRGMITKVRAAQRAARGGANTVVASGRLDGVLRRLAAGEPRAHRREGGGDDALPHESHADVAEARAFHQVHDASGRRGGGGTQAPEPELRHAGDRLARRPRPTRRRDVRHREGAAGSQHAERLGEERGARREVEGRLDADEPVEGTVGEGEARRVRVHRRRAGLREPRATVDELRARDVHRDEPPRGGDVADERVLRAEAVADVEDVDAAREVRSDLGHESPHGRGRLGQVGSVPRPQAQVQPPLVEREIGRAHV